MKPFTKLTLLSLAALLVFGVLAAGSGESGSTGGSSSGTSAPSTKEVVIGQVKLDYTWSKDFGDIMMANFTINNPSDHSFKDFEIRCDHSAKSGTHIDSNTRTIYEVVKAHSKRTFRNFNMGFIHSQAASSSCRITDLVPLD
jgi:type 1 fimbria pilin